MTTALAIEAESPDLDEHSYILLIARAKQALQNKKKISVDVSQIRPCPTQPRQHFDPEGLRLLGESIDATGQAVSGLVRVHPDGNGFELIDGERRWRSISAIPEERRPFYQADLIEAEDDVVQFLISGIANFNRAGHTTVESLETIVRLRNLKIPMEEIAKLLGISLFWATQIYGLRNLVPPVLKLLDPKIKEKQRLPVTAAVHISKMDASMQETMANRVLRKEVPLSDLRAVVVSTAKEAGLPVRTRETAPREQWASTITAANNLAQLAERIRKDLNSSEVTRYAKTRPSEVIKMKQDLSTVEEAIRISREMLRRYS